MSDLRFSDVKIGDTLPPLSVDISSRLITGAAIATRDYQDVHRDADAARALGSPDIFMNILTSNGFVGRYVTDWTGPKGVLKRVAIKLGAPNYPGDTMTLSGEVLECQSEDNTVTLKIVGANNLGKHVMGDITVQLP